MPLCITRFYGLLKDEVVGLHWQTQAEHGVHSYIVERSMDGIHFTNIANITSKQTAIADYHFEDDIRSIQHSNIRFYRIKQMQTGGSFHCSTIITIRLQSKDVEKIRLFPNPTSAYSNLEFYVQKSTKVNLVLITASGSVLQSLPLALNAGTNVIALPQIAQLSNGIYWIKLISPETSFSIKLKKQ